MAPYERVSCSIVGDLRRHLCRGSQEPQGGLQVDSWCCTHTVAHHLSWDECRLPLVVHCGDMSCGGEKNGVLSERGCGMEEYEGREVRIGRQWDQWNKGMDGALSERGMRE